MNAYIEYCKYSKGSAGVGCAGGPHAAHIDALVCTHPPHFIFSYLLDHTMIPLLRLSQVSHRHA